MLLLATAAWAENRIPAGSVRIPNPNYPAKSLERGEQGEVLLLVTVSPRGMRSVKIGESSGYPLLDEAALQAAKHGTYPKSGRWTIFSLPVQFTIREETPPPTEEEMRKIFENGRVQPKP